MLLLFIQNALVIVTIIRNCFIHYEKVNSVLYTVTQCYPQCGCGSATIVLHYIQHVICTFKVAIQAITKSSVANA